MSNIYEDIFYDSYGFPISELDEVKAAGIKETVIQLRNSYKCDTPKAIYDKESIRKAYMLAYYVHYVKPIEKLMKEKIIKIIEEKNNSKLRLSFFAAGPAPEVYGTLKSLSDYGFSKRIEVIILDFEKEWEKERNSTVNLIKKLHKIKISSMEYISGCDLRLDCSAKCGNWINCENRVFFSDILIMQNCINHMKDDFDFANKLKQKISYMQDNSLFVIIDLDYNNVKRVIKSISEFTRENTEIIATNIYENADISSIDIPMPENMTKYIFTCEKNLIPKKNTYYYYLILRKKKGA